MKDHAAESSSSTWRLWVSAGIIVAAGVAAYHNSFHGPFVFDDQPAIVRNQSIHKLWPIWKTIESPPAVTTAGRPVVSLSLALNYKLSQLFSDFDDGLEVGTYHAMNLWVHVMAALVMFGIVRRTLLSDRLRERFGHKATSLALLCALLWAVHPLLTSAVTYVIQRAESLMGLLYLLTIYCAIRARTGQYRRWWSATAIVFCALGMGTKEVMVSAPVMVLLHDWLFMTEPCKKILARRWGLYVGLACTWIVLAVLVWTAPRGQTAGFGLALLKPLEYAKTQCTVIFHYLNLALWPRQLVFDYGTWPIPRQVGDYAISAAVILAMILATGWAIYKRAPWGFLGAWFFLILGPTSRFVRIQDKIFEHRMYLSLAAVVVLGVFLVHLQGGDMWRRSLGTSQRLQRTGQIIGYGLAAAAIVILAGLTIQRNRDYRSDIAIWSDTLRKWPKNWRAYNNRGLAYKDQGLYDKAIDDYTEAIKLVPRYADAYNNRGVAYGQTNQFTQALQDLNTAIELRSTFVRAYNNRGNVYRQKGWYDLAIRDYEEALMLDPGFRPARVNREQTLRTKSRQ